MDTLQTCIAGDVPVTLIGASFGLFIYSMVYVHRSPTQLPDGSRPMDAGGFKGACVL